MDSTTFNFVSFVTTLSGGPETETISLTDDQIITRDTCDEDAGPQGPGYEQFTDFFVSHITNDGVVVGTCSDIYFNPASGDSVGWNRAYIATPTK